MFQKGFSLIEVIVVIGLMSFIFIIAGTTYFGFQRSIQLNENSNQIVQLMRTAKIKSMARVNDSTHGIYFDINTGGADAVTLYEGASYASRVVGQDQIINVPNSLRLSSSDFSMLGTDVDINFSQGFGKPNNIGTITVEHAELGSRSIIINTLGLVDSN